MSDYRGVSDRLSTLEILKASECSSQLYLTSLIGLIANKRGGKP